MLTEHACDMRGLCSQVCCHPFLCNGLEEHIEERQRGAAKSGAAPGELARLVHSSGKMVLLDKLLPKLRAEGHKARAPCLAGINPGIRVKMETVKVMLPSFALKLYLQLAACSTTSPLVRMHA
jgi:hypothetical protein